MIKKDLKKLILSGVAIDATYIDNIERLHLTVVDVTTGVYGVSGGLFKSPDGQLYIILSRCTNLFRII